MATDNPQRGEDIAARRTLIRWALFLTFVHTIPAPWFYLIIAGMAPTSVILAAGLAGTFWISEGTSSFALFALAPALLYCLILYGAASLLSVPIARIPNHSLQTGLVFVTAAALLVAAFQPIYPFGGHSGTDYGSIAEFWPLTRLPVEVFYAYTTAFVLLLAALLVRLYRGRPPSRIFFGRLRGSRAIKAAAWTGGLGVAAAFLFVNHVLLLCRPLAELGSVGAQMCMGRAMLHTEPNALWGENDARTWFERAAERGNAEAARELYRMGKDERERLHWLEIAAGNGDREAQYELYRRMSKATRIATERESAMRWLHAAAENGDARAQYDLASLLRRGAEDRGISKDLDKARQWLERAVEQQHPDALWEAANHYEQGTQRFPLDLEQAKSLYEQYAELADTEGFGNRRGMTAYRNPQSHIATIDDLQRGLENGEPEALKNLATRHLEAHEPAPGTRERGMELLGRAAESGDIEAEYRRGAIYMFGRYDVAKDEARGRASWTRAAENGHVKATERVADGLINGQFGFEVDYLKARTLVVSLIAAYREEKPGTAQHGNRARRWDAELEFIERAVERAGGNYEPKARLREQAAADDARAQYQLARQLFVENQIKNGQEWFDLYRKAANNGHVEAQMELFGLFRRGVSYTTTADPGAPPRIIVPKDEPKALHSLEQAASGRHPAAMVELALAYAKGRFGMDKDLVKARDLFLEIMRSAENDAQFGEIDESTIAMLRSQLEYAERALRHAEERRQRYERATDLEKKIMAIEDKYQQRYHKRANAVCRGMTQCTREYMQVQRKRIRQEISAQREKEIAQLRRNASIVD